MRKGLVLLLVGSLVAVVALTAPSAGAHAIVVPNRQLDTQQDSVAGNPNAPDWNLAAAGIAVAAAGIVLAAVQGRLLGRPGNQITLRGQLTDEQIQRILNQVSSAAGS